MSLWDLFANYLCEIIKSFAISDHIPNISFEQSVLEIFFLIRSYNPIIKIKNKNAGYQRNSKVNLYTSKLIKFYVQC